MTSTPWLRLPGRYRHPGVVIVTLRVQSAAWVGRTVPRARAGGGARSEQMSKKKDKKKDKKSKKKGKKSKKK